jgi:hypothetical protein
VSVAHAALSRGLSEPLCRNVDFLQKSAKNCSELAASRTHAGVIP